MTHRDDYTRFPDLAEESLGGRALCASDEFFAPKENLLKAEAPRFIEGKYTDRGKWMDGWESRRRRGPGHDWCIIRLAVPCAIRGVNIDTTHFRGNHPQTASIDACLMESDIGPDQLTGPDVAWHPILERSDLQPHSANLFAIEDGGCFSHVRLNIFPDGGVARLRVLGEPRPDWGRLGASGSPIDLASVLVGGRILECSDMFFSAPQNLLRPGRPANMGEGWETRRRRGPGHDWCIIRLGCRGVIESVEVDTRHFKGNYPDRCSFEGADAPAGASPAGLAWMAFGPTPKLEADRMARFEIEPPGAGPFTHVRFNIFPDGGVARLRLYGRPLPPGANP